jgi:hypothetical protein
MKFKAGGISMVSTKAKIKTSRLRTILIEGRQHWDDPGFNPDVRLSFLRALECRTPALGSRVYASENEEAVFCNTCKSPACTGCGHWATIHWQRERWCALPEGPYMGVTLSMPDTLWPLFSANPHLTRELPSIAASAIMIYGKVYKGIDVGVMAILHTFNGKLEFNSHVHALVFAKDLQSPSQSGESRIFFNNSIMRSWKRLVIALLRAALNAGCLVSTLTDRELEHLLRREEGRWWSVHIQSFNGKEHFVRYAGRYARRPPISERRIRDVSNGLVSFWYMDKRLKRPVTVVCTVTEFIDRWTLHIPKRYRHAVRHCGIFAPRRWNQVAEAAFLLSGQRRRPKPRPLRWNFSVQRLSGHDPLTDSKGRQMRFVKHLPPVAA